MAYIFFTPFKKYQPHYVFIGCYSKYKINEVHIFLNNRTIACFLKIYPLQTITFINKNFSQKTKNNN